MSKNDDGDGDGGVAKKLGSSGGGYVSRDECRELMQSNNANINKLYTAMFGEDGRGGMNKEFNDVVQRITHDKNREQFWTSIFVGILSSVFASLTVSFILMKVFKVA